MSYYLNNGDNFGTVLMFNGVYTRVANPFCHTKSGSVFDFMKLEYSSVGMETTMEDILINVALSLCDIFFLSIINRLSISGSFNIWLD